MNAVIEKAVRELQEANVTLATLDFNLQEVNQRHDALAREIDEARTDLRAKEKALLQAAREYKV